jgi:hypothetical protein
VRIAISDAKRPIPENRAIETSSPCPDFSECLDFPDEANDAEMGAAIRMTVGMSNAPVGDKKTRPTQEVRARRMKVQRNARKALKYVRRTREPIGTTAI